MAIEALKSVGAVYQASSTPEIAKEVSQPKTQIIDIQTGSAALAADAVKVNAKEANEQQGSGQESQGKAESENLKKAVEQINQKMSDSEAVFGIHEKTNRITIKIVDKKTKEVTQGVLECDATVICTGITARPSDGLKARCEELGIPVEVIGDAAGARDCTIATREGYDAGMAI